MSFRSEAPSEFNQELRAYEQVAKLQRYRLAEGAEEEFDEDFVLKPCDLSLLDSADAADRGRFTADLGESLEDTGFAILTGHGVDPALYAEAHRRTRGVLRVPPARGEAALPRPPAGLREPGLLPDAGDHGDPPGSRGGAGSSAAGRSTLDRSGLGRSRLLALTRLGGLLPADRACPRAADPPAHAVHPRLPGRRSRALRRPAHGDQLRVPAELLPADDRCPRRNDREDARPRGRGPLHHPPRGRDRRSAASPPRRP